MILTSGVVPVVPLLLVHTYTAMVEQLSAKLSILGPLPDSVLLCPDEELTPGPLLASQLVSSILPLGLG